MKDKNQNVEVLRGILMIWIILFHYTTRYNELFSGIYPYEFENGGIIGVTFFFILSGYFYYSGILKMKKLTPVEVSKFCVNKYWRLYPAYLISIILIFIVYQFINLSGRECTFKDFVVNSLFIYHPYISYVDSAHWFIAILIKIQIISALFLLLKSSIRNYVILFFELFIFFLLIYSSKYNTPLVHKMVVIFSPDSFLKFLVGYNLYMIISHHNKSRYLHLFLGLLIIGYYSFTIHMALIVIYTILTFFVLQNQYIPNYKYIYKPLIIVGKYSFTWYLIHQNIGFAIINQLNVWELNNEFWLLIPMAITFGIAIVIMKITNLLPCKIFTI